VRLQPLYVRFLRLLSKYHQILEQIVAQFSTVNTYVTVTAIQKIVLGKIGPSHNHFVVEQVYLLVMHARYLA
jgi:hypothetical protein